MSGQQSSSNSSNVRKSIERARDAMLSKSSRRKNISPPVTGSSLQRPNTGQFSDPKMPIAVSDPSSPIMRYTFEWGEPTGVVNVWVDIKTGKIIDAMDSHGNYIRHDGKEYVGMN